MGQQLTDRGEEYFIKAATGEISSVSSISIGLYNDGTDAIGETDDLAAITTEPAGANYSRQTNNLPGDVTISQIDGDWQFELGDITFDASDSTQNVDGYFVVANFQGDGDGSATDHLIATGSLDQEYDLDSVDTLNHSSGGISIS